MAKNRLQAGGIGKRKAAADEHDRAVALSIKVTQVAAHAMSMLKADPLDRGSDGGTNDDRTPQ